MSFFKGYIKTKNKKAIEKFKDKTSDELHTLEEVKGLPEYAGILASDSILIDFDDAESAEIAFKIVDGLQLNCRVLESTRGMHLLFKNSKVMKCFTGTKLICGLKADIKVGKTNSYEILKYKDKERAIIYDIFEDEGEVYDEVPLIFQPIANAPEFVNDDVGDGRNTKLFAYILTLQEQGIDNSTIIEILDIINKYVFKQPLSDEEFKIIVREESFKSRIPSFYKGTTFLFDKFATYLKNNHHIKRINNQLHLYKDGIYISGYSEIEAEMIKHLPQLNRSKRTEVLSYLDILIRESTNATEVKWIAFKNGLLNIYTDEFITFTPEHVITNKIEWNYKPEAYHKLTDQTLNKIACNDPQIRMLLEEMVGYCMFRRNELGKAFILTGSGSNGKSTFLNMLKNMLGKRNVSSLDLKKLNDRFSTVMLYGKLANIGDDISDEFITDAADFKKIVTGETIDAEQKGQPKFEFEPYVKLLFSANNIPRIGKGRDSSAILRRLIIVPFNATFNSSDPDYVPFIGDKLRDDEAMEYLISLGIKALKRVLETRNFTVSQEMQKELEEYEESNNPVIGFFKEIEVEKIENEPTKDVYKRYQVHCAENNYHAISNIEFSKQVKKHFGFEIADKRINGKKCRVFVKNF